jgi:hypothetical protein
LVAVKIERRRLYSLRRFFMAACGGSLASQLLQEMRRTQNL